METKTVVTLVTVGTVAGYAGWRLLQLSATESLTERLLSRYKDDLNDWEVRFNEHLRRVSELQRSRGRLRRGSDPPPPPVPPLPSDPWWL